MFDLSVIPVDYDGDGVPDQEVRDMDEDGDIDGDDLRALGLKPGTAKAKAAWDAIEAASKRAGEYQGKPLRPGPHPGDGDFSLLRDRLVWRQGMSPEAATKVAAGIKNRLYPGG